MYWEDPLLIVIVNTVVGLKHAENGQQGVNEHDDRFGGDFKMTLINVSVYTERSYRKVLSLIL